MRRELARHPPSLVLLELDLPDMHGYDALRLLNEISSRHWHPADRSVDVMVSKLRRKLGDDQQRPRLLKTVRGIGYKLAARVERLRPDELVG